MYKVLQVLLSEMLPREWSVSDGHHNSRSDDELDAGDHIEHDAGADD